MNILSHLTTGGRVTVGEILAKAAAGNILVTDGGTIKYRTASQLLTDINAIPYTGATQDVDLGAFKLNAQSLHIKGTAGNGHLGLKHQSASATSSANESVLFSDSLGDIGWQNANLYLSKFIISANSANRSYTFPNATGIVALTSDLTGYLTAVTATSPLSSSGGTTPNITIAQSNGSTNGYLSSTDWTTFNNKQATLSLTTTGSSGAATLVGATLNIPQYQGVLTNPVTGTGTTNYLPKFTSSSAIGNSIIYDNGTQLGVNTSSISNTILTIYDGSVNGDILKLETASTKADIWFNDAGTTSGALRIRGESSSLKFITGSAIRMTLTDIGNLGLGVTPSAWATYPAMQILRASFWGAADNGYFGTNYYWDGSTRRYINSNFANELAQVSGEFRFYTAPSGTAGNAITFTQAMTLFSTGNLAVGGTSDAGYKLDVSGTGRFSDVLYSTKTSGRSFGNDSYGTNFGWIAMYGTSQGIQLGFEGTTGGQLVTGAGANFGILVGKVGLAISANNGVTNHLNIASTGAATFSSSVTATSLIKSGGTSSQYLMADGSTSTLTNPVTGTGTTNYLPKFTGTSTIGNSAVQDDGTSITILSRIVGIYGASEAGWGLKVYENLKVQNNNGTTILQLADTATGGKSWSLISSGTGNVHSVPNGTFYLRNSSDSITALQVTASGNLGLSVTPSAWGSNYKAIQGGNGSNGVGGSLAFFNNLANGVLLYSNATNDNTNDIYTFTAPAAKYVLENNVYKWFQAPQGTAGNAISFTQAMTLFSTGNLAVGGTSDAGYRLDVNGTGRYFVNSNSVVDILTLHNNSATSSGVRQLFNNGYGNLAAIRVSQRDNGSLADDGQIEFQVASNSVLDTKLTILNTGAATFSSSVTAGGLITINKQNEGLILTAGANTDASYMSTRANNSTGWLIIGSQGSVANYIQSGTGANESAITTVGAYALALGTNQTERMRITSGGNVLINTTTDAGYKLDVNGTGRFSGSLIADATVKIWRGGGAISSNTAVGENSLASNTTGVQNSAVGLNALYYNTTGYQNSALGVASLQNNTTGYQNSALGVASLQNNTTGNYNSAVGVNALYSNTTGFNNSALGVQALYSNTTGYYNSALGVEALQNNTTGTQNSAVGMNALYYNTTGNYNSAVGVSALQNNTTGYYNSALGVSALYSNTTGFNNSAVGLNALYYNTTGVQNSAVGVQALQNNTTGTNNSALGVDALRNNTTGYYNSAVGVNAGRYTNAGGANETSNNSLYLGYDTRASASGNTNEIVIGANNLGGGSNSVTLGNTSITQTTLQGNVRAGTYDGGAPYPFQSGYALSLGEGSVGSGKSLICDGAIAIGNNVTVAGSDTITHKVQINIGGTTYYLLASNV